MQCMTRMELRYCERCGALKVEAANTNQRSCTRCAELLAWMGVGGAR